MVGVTPYPFEENEETDKRKFFFKSTGKTSIIKAVEYTYLQPWGIGGLYNLGFGDYDKAARTIVDDANSNNGDMYAVFSTVLATALEFFEEHPFDTIAVSGSDSGEEFAEQCRRTCIGKRCGIRCKNVDRRIDAYHFFVDRNMKTLGETYVFSGYIKALKRLVPYEVGTKYDAIFVSQKNQTTFASS